MQIGKHGLIIEFTDPSKNTRHSATYLPEVAAHEGEVLNWMPKSPIFYSKVTSSAFIPIFYRKVQVIYSSHLSDPEDVIPWCWLWSHRTVKNQKNLNVEMETRRQKWFLTDFTIFTQLPYNTLLADFDSSDIIFFLIFLTNSNLISSCLLLSTRLDEGRNNRLVDEEGRL